MAINPVNSGTTLAAQLLQQTNRQSPVAPANGAASQAAGTGQTQPPAKTVEQPQPVVNTQGQTTGKVINTTA